MNTAVSRVFLENPEIQSETAVTKNSYRGLSRERPKNTISNPPNPFLTPPNFPQTDSIHQILDFGRSTWVIHNLDLEKSSKPKTLKKLEKVKEEHLPLIFAEGGEAFYWINLPEMDKKFPGTERKGGIGRALKF